MLKYYQKSKEALHVMRVKSCDPPKATRGAAATYLADPRVLQRLAGLCKLVSEFERESSTKLEVDGEPPSIFQVGLDDEDRVVSFGAAGHEFIEEGGDGRKDAVATLVRADRVTWGAEVLVPSPSSGLLEAGVVDQSAQSARTRRGETASLKDHVLLLRRRAPRKAADEASRCGQEGGAPECTEPPQAALELVRANCGVHPALRSFIDSPVKKDLGFYKTLRRRARRAEEGVTDACVVSIGKAIEGLEASDCASVFERATEFRPSEALPASERRRVLFDYIVGELETKAEAQDFEAWRGDAPLRRCLWKEDKGEYDRLRDSMIAWDNKNSTVSDADFIETEFERATASALNAAYKETSAACRALNETTDDHNAQTLGLLLNADYDAFKPELERVVAGARERALEGCAKSLRGLGSVKREQACLKTVRRFLTGVARVKETAVPFTKEGVGRLYLESTEGRRLDPPLSVESCAAVLVGERDFATARRAYGRVEDGPDEAELNEKLGVGSQALLEAKKEVCEQYVEKRLPTVPVQLGDVFSFVASFAIPTWNDASKDFLREFTADQNHQRLVPQYMQTLSPGFASEALRAFEAWRDRSPSDLSALNEHLTVIAHLFTPGIQALIRNAYAKARRIGVGATSTATARWASSMFLGTSPVVSSVVGLGVGGLAQAVDAGLGHRASLEAEAPEESVRLALVNKCRVRLVEGERYFYLEAASLLEQLVDRELLAWLRGKLHRALETTGVLFAGLWAAYKTIVDERVLREPTFQTLGFKDSLRSTLLEDPQIALQLRGLEKIAQTASKHELFGSSVVSVYDVLFFLVVFNYFDLPIEVTESSWRYVERVFYRRERGGETWRHSEKNFYRVSAENAQRHFSAASRRQIFDDKSRLPVEPPAFYPLPPLA